MGETIPDDISRWKEEQLQNLSIEIQHDVDITPLELIKNHHRCSQNAKNYDFDHMTKTEAEVLRNFKFYPTVEFLALRSHLGISTTEIDYWLSRFHANGMEFAECLFHTIVKRDLDVRFDSDGHRISSLCEYDFQFLFDSFVSMFGLRSFKWFAPCMPETKLRLSDKDVAGKADILFCQDVAHTLERPLSTVKNIIAVCDIKKECHNSHLPTLDKQVDSSNACSASTRKTSLPSHISSSQLAQHGGHLVLYSRQSFAEDVIYGLIVQQTKISFTALRMTKCEYEGIVNVKPEATKPKLIITRPYDYLKEKDRLYIIRPLLELAMIQETQLLS